MRRRLARLLRPRKRWAPPAAPEPEPERSGLGEPPALPLGADDAELDALRGELVRELDRMAAGHGGPATFRRC